MAHDENESKDLNWKTIFVFYIVLQIVLPIAILLSLYFLYKSQQIKPNIFFITIGVTAFLFSPIGIYNTLKKILIKKRKESEKNKSLHNESKITKESKRPFLVTDILNTAENELSNDEYKQRQIKYNLNLPRIFKQVILFIKISLAVVILFSSTLYFSRPKGIVVNEKGKVEKITNKIRAIFQGKKFWDFQYNLAITKYEKLLNHEVSFYKDMMTLENTSRDLKKSQNELLKDYYSKEELLAQSLRSKADSIEKDHEYRIIEQSLEEFRLSEINKLRLIIPKIRSRQNIVKQTFTLNLILYSTILLILIVIFSTYKINISRRKKN